MKAWIELAGFAVLVALAAGVVFVWRDVQRQQGELQERLKSTEQLLQAAASREDARKAALEQQLANMARQEKAVQQPRQVLQALPEVLPLPTALRAEETAAVGGAGAVNGAAKAEGAVQGRADGPAPKVLLPTEDLKPLYDFALKCKACQAELAAAQADLRDEKAKTQAVGRERDNALRAARGGSVLQRVGRAAKWFVLGAAAGAVAAKMAR